MPDAWGVSITQQPISTNVLLGANAFFVVGTSGGNPISYWWQLNGTNLVNDAHVGGANASVLRITNVVAADAGNYRVIVSNSASVKTSSVAKLTVLFPPVITNQPVSQSAWNGTSPAFTVRASGSPPLKYQWSFNGTKLLGATNATLVLTNVQPSKTGIYSVSVTNSFGIMQSSNATLIVNTVVPGVPFIGGFVPLSTNAGATVMIQGTNFSPVLSNNIVLFGAVRAKVTACSSTNLLVTVPLGATYAPITVTVNGFTGYGNVPFQPTFIGDGSDITTGTFAPRQSLQVNNGPIRTVIADLDGDGKPDVIVVNAYSHVISMFRNIGANGGLSVNSFAPRVDFPVISGGSVSPYQLIAADVDGDGKLDLIVLDNDGNRVGIYRNISTPGTLTTASFEAPVFFTVGTDPRGLAARDLDGDGRTDLVTANFGDGSISILRNTGSPGSFTAGSFAPKVDITLDTEMYSVAIQDLDGDGKPDLAVAGYGSNFLWVLRNVSIAGFLNTNSFAPRINLPTLSQQAAIVAGDLDADGRPELIAGGNSTSMSVNRNLADPGTLAISSFASSLNYSAIGWIHDLALGDLNGDGKTDIILDGELNSYLAVFQNLGAPGGFSSDSLGARVDFATGLNAWGVSVGDLDGDGRPDAVLCNFYDGTISLYQNLTPFGGPPSILVQPTNTVVFAKNTASFTVFGEGKSTLSYQWSLNGTNLTDNAHISGATTPTLVISNAQTNDNGNYMLAITNSLGSVNSAIATLTVLFPPDITIQPANPVALYGSNITLIASGTGASPMSYQWKKNGTNLADGGNISGTTTMALSLTNAQFGDAGVYSVLVTNIFGSVTNFVPLRVTVPAGTWVKWDASVGGNGHSFKGVVNTSGLNWTQADQIARNEGGYLATITSAEENNFVFNMVNDPQFFSGIGFNGSGPALGGIRTNSASPVGSDWVWETGESWDYTAWASGQPDFQSETRLEFWSGVQGSPSPTWNNLVPNDSNLGGYVIEREDFPSIVFQPTNQTVAVGTNVSFAVVALGSPTLTYQWVANGTNIDGATNAALTLTNVQLAQTGYYFVVVSNLFGMVVSSNATLTVMTPPAIIQSPTNLTVTVGGTATFNALVAGDPPLSYQWRLNNVPLNDSVRVIGSATDTLTISNVQNSDAGNYTIVVTNLVGSVSGPATLTVITPPSITKQPVGYSVPVGLPVSFTANAAGTAPLRYQWLLNGAPVPSATNVNLTISNTIPNDFGAYQLVVTNFGGAVTSSVAMLTIGPVATWNGLGFAGANSTSSLAPPGLTNVTAVGAGSGYSLLLKTDGSLVGWGTGVVTNVPTLNDAVAIAAGSTHALALRANGTVVAWGVNASGQTNVPPGLSNVVAITAGTTHSVALRNDGTVIAWGVADPRLQKVASVPPTLTKVVAIDGGGSQTLALLENRMVTSWDGNGPLGIPAGLNNIADISAGPGFSAFNMVLFTNGTVAAWGAFGPATNLPTGLGGVVDVEAGGGSDQSTGFGMALRTNGLIRAWGSFGSPTNVPSGLSNVVAMAGGLSHCLALVNDGRPLFLRPPVGGTAFTGGNFKLKSTVVGNETLVYRWQHDGVDVPGGTNDVLNLSNIQTNDAGMYQLIVSNGLGVATSLAVPVTVMDSAPFFLLQPAQTNRVFLGSRFTLPTSVSGSGPMQFQWRFNDDDIPGATNDALLLARTHMTNAGNYVLVVSNSFGAVTSVVANVTVSQVVMWGDSPNGQTNVPASLTNAVAVVANANSQFTMALHADGTVTAWGYNGNGQTNVPADITNVVEIANSYWYSLVLKSDGTVRTWGSVTAGFSAALADLTNIVAIEADYSGATFLRTNGTVIRLNANGSGIINLSQSPTNVVALAPFDDGVAILRADGTVLTTGSGSLPPATTNVLGLGFARYDGLYLKRDSSLVSWGSPVMPTNILVNFSNMVDVAANNSTKFAVRSDGTVATWNTGFTSNTNVPAGLTNVGVLDAGGNFVVTLLFARDLPTVFLPDALDTPALVVSSKASPQWFGQRSITHDGVDAAQSAEIGNNTASSMRLFVNGPINLSFWWKVSSATNHHFLNFSTGGVLLTNISGEVGWQQCTFTLPAGPQLLVWTYAKDGNDSAGQDAGWVDQIALTPIAPTILAQPLGKDVLGGSNVTFSVEATGTPPLNYRWLKNSTPVFSASGPLYNIFGVTRADSGTYSVIVTNLGGSVTSSNAVLTVHVPQNLGVPVAQPDGTFLLTSADADGGALTAGDLANLQVQVTTNLVDWTTLPDALILTNGTIQLQDTGAVDQPMRFYRIIESW